MWFDLTDIAASYPHEVARVTAHLLTGTEEPVHDSYQLRELVARLKPLLPADALRPLVEEALARGVHGAASWLA